MTLTDNELRRVSERGLVGIIISYLHAMNDGLKMDAVIAARLNISPKTLAHAQRGQAHLGAQRIIELQRMAGLDLFDRWYQLRKEEWA